MRINFKSLKKQAQKSIGKSRNFNELNEVLKEYLGKQGKLTLIFRSLEKLPKKQRQKTGSQANELKNFFKEKFEKKEREIKEKMPKASAASKNWIDVTAPGKKPQLGPLHPLTITRREVESIFESMGFSIAEGPEMENEWYNFDALNIPKDHPARDAWDTFWLRQNEIKNQKSKIKNERLLLRPHTSPVQIRYLEKNNPPLRIIAPGTVFRHEATDASHEFQLFQVEGLMVDKEISVANLKAIVGEFFKRFFEKDVDFRLRPDFFPFVEPD